MESFNAEKKDACPKKQLLSMSCYILFFALMYLAPFIAMSDRRRIRCNKFTRPSCAAVNGGIAY